MAQHAVTTRKRAPSRRSLEARARIFDAAEQVFAERGFEGASIRDIAERARVQKASVNFHGGAKEDLFERIVTRRADELSTARIAALEAVGPCPRDPAAELIAAFAMPLLDRAFGGDPQWMAYARLIAIVSADPRWNDLTARLYDPVAMTYARRLSASYPDASPEDVAAGMVFSVSAMLALCTSQWRITALSPGNPDPGRAALIDRLIDYCAAGMTTLLGAPVR
ncbi:TetR/AcrR family transcriptional regulator [Pukyongiella litopenaei]|uniref:TetR/AcrR family transcriptional regulator n=1 Tax=Pukyongiella litopenaei TaxID=2605946 RepID=A0A2S0MUJ7_9RHOB|nr:TetR family transcriptional regulator [Pukyongiella litopenaei]AVO39569.1 TetR/AcrR family transcriptional regulator [Pukyongiella litopenaei]